MAMPGQPMPQGAPAPAPGPNGAAAPGPNAQGMPTQGGQGPSGPKMSAQQAILMIHQGFQALGGVMSAAPAGALTPQDKQMFNNLVTGFQSFVQELGKPPAQPNAAAGPAPMHKGAPMPMPAHANSGAKAAY